jgi:hypothetical protein
MITLVFLSCKRQESIYEDYVVPNGYTYPGKALEVTAYPGKNRVQIEWKTGSDPNVVKARISWNNNTEGIDVDIQPGEEIIRKIVEPLDENTYTFQVRTYDAKGNVSVPVETIGTAYGEIFESSLQNRRIKSKIYDGKDLTLEWDAANEIDFGVHLTYSDIFGENHTVTVETTDFETFLPDFNVDEPLSYYSLIKPDSLSIDLFQAPLTSTMIDPNILLPKNRWAEFSLPYDIEMLNVSAANPGGQYPIRNLWDNNTGNFCHTVESATLPIMISWDLGVKTILSQMKLWPRTHGTDNFSQSCPQDFEMWGSLEPNPSGELDNTWTLLGTFKCIKPSGTLGAGTAIDQAAAQAGIVFDFVDPSATVRYIRLRALSTFAAAGQNHRLLLAEVEFRGKLIR